MSRELTVCVIATATVAGALGGCSRDEVDDRPATSPTGEPLVDKLLTAFNSSNYTDAISVMCGAAKAQFTQTLGQDEFANQTRNIVDTEGALTASRTSGVVIVRQDSASRSLQVTIGHAGSPAKFNVTVVKRTKSAECIEDILRAPATLPSTQQNGQPERREILDGPRALDLEPR